MANAAITPMIPTTTNNSISENPCSLFIVTASLEARSHRLNKIHLVTDSIGARSVPSAQRTWLDPGPRAVCSDIRLARAILREASVRKGNTDWARNHFCDGEKLPLRPLHRVRLKSQGLIALLVSDRVTQRPRLPEETCRLPNPMLVQKV